MQTQSASSDQRHLSERRIREMDLSPGMEDRRIQAERRGLEVMELDFDESIALDRGAEQQKSVLWF
jgi:hypothetical protein